MAGRFSVESVFKAVDRITAPVSRMQNRVGKFTRSMERGLRSANKALGKLTGGLAKGAKSIAKFGGVAIAGGIVAVTLAMNNAADAADQLAKLTTRLKFPIEEFQEWQFVAEQSGLSADEFGNAMEKFSRSVGEARNGAGALTTALKKSDPALLHQLKIAKNSSEAFDLYRNAIRNTSNQMDKAALASAGFGRAGRKLLNITELTEDQIKALRLEQRENGNITLAQADAAQAYNDAVNTLKRSLSGLINNVLLPMLPVITETIKAFRNWIVANKELVKSRIAAFIENMRKRVMSLIDSFQRVGKEQSVFEKLKAVAGALSTAFDFLAEHGPTILKVVGAVVALSLALKAFIIVMTAVNLVMSLNPIGLVVLGIAALVAAIVGVIAFWDELKAVFLSLPGPVKSALEVLFAPIALLAEGAQLIMDNWEPIKAFFVDLWGGITATFDAAIANIVAIIDRVKNTVSDLGDLVPDIPSVSDIGSFFGFDGDEGGTGGGPGGPQVVSPQERTARTIDEQRTTSTAEVTIRDETKRAEVTGGKLGAGLSLIPTGAF